VVSHRHSVLGVPFVCHPRESGDLDIYWVPAYAGMTMKKRMTKDGNKCRRVLVTAPSFAISAVFWDPSAYSAITIIHRMVAAVLVILGWKTLIAGTFIFDILT
jgi:hypothetical protein